MNTIPQPEPSARKRFFSVAQLEEFKKMIPSQMDRDEFKELCRQLAEALVILENATRVINTANSAFSDENPGIHLAQTTTGSWEYTVDGHEGKVQGFATRREGYRDAAGQLAKVELEVALRNAETGFNSIREERDELAAKVERFVAQAAPPEVKCREVEEVPPHRTFIPVVRTEIKYENDGKNATTSYEFQAVYKFGSYGHQVVGRGTTPAAAVKAFDEAWKTVTLIKPPEPTEPTEPKA